MKIVRKFGFFASLLLVACLMLGASSCEQKLDGTMGVPTVNADGTTNAPPKVTIPAVVDTLNSVGQSVPGPWTPILGVLSVLLGTGGLVQTVLKGRTQNALNATVSGAVSFAKANPTMAASLMDHIDAAHDAHGVTADHQDAVQSALAPPKIGS